MQTTYLKQPSGPSFPTAGKADLEITFEPTKAYFTEDRPIAEIERDRMVSRYPNYSWSVVPVPSTPRSGFMIVGDLITYPGQ